ncbi:ATP-binding protein [Sphingomonas sp. H39-1-10]|uniref:DAHL domain-containing protein n=1 Tax=Sphingomonas pollutisoli TaxID=3030829 RepID=UPI0023B9B65E|nr:DAHL domain-containing protein [Sphingomonas pollutisoli]MDF0487868.1 ATP-binding protein [Sphingomonas pollutisoli]
MKWLAPLRVAMICTAIATAILMVAQLLTYNADRPWPDRAMQALDRLALADRSVERDVLSARAGLFRNYDSVTNNALLASTAVDELRALTREQGDLARKTQALGDRIHAREEVVEQFKTDNALVQNALARFAETSESLRSGDSRVERLAIELMRLTLHTGDGVPEATRQRLRLLVPGPGEMSRPEKSEFADQARLLVDLLPEVDRLLVQLKSLNSDGLIESVRRGIAVQQDLDAARRLYQLIALAVTSALTLLIATAFILLMRVRARSAIHQAENERLSATVARILLDPMTLSLQERIIRSLQELASHAGANRGFLVIGDPIERTYEWPGGGNARPGWSILLETLDQDLWRDDLIERIDAIPNIGGNHVDDPRACAMLLRTTEPTPAILGFRRNDGPFELRPYVVAGLRVALAAILQAVERERLEGDRIRLERTLARARRMETVGAMASGIAHNFNNIMGAIAGFSELALTRTRPGSAVRRNLEEIESAVNRAQQLAEQVLGFGRRAHEQDVIAIADLVGEAVRLLRATLPEGFTVTVREPIPKALIEGSEAQLQQVLLNIGTNAAHAMPNGGRIDVCVELHAFDHALPMSHGSLEPGHYVLISIADQGIGMSADQVEQIFQPFYTTRPSGTGLGLSTAWEVVQDRQGTIDVESEPGAGSRFMVWLPVLRLDRIELTPAIFASLQGRGERVALVAAYASRPLLEEQLAILGYEPLGPANATDAATIIDACLRASADALLLVQPEPSLVAALAHASAAQALAIPVLISGAADASADDFRQITWPLREGELAAALKLALHGSAEPASHPA